MIKRFGASHPCARSNGTETQARARTLGTDRCLAVVAPGASEPDLSAIEAFIVEPGQW
jgi:ureidoglycolate hydrolase